MSPSLTSCQCTMAQALKKFGIKDFAKIMTLAVFDSFDKEKHLAQHLGNFASFKKGLNIIGSKMGTQ